MLEYLIQPLCRENSSILPQRDVLCFKPWEDCAFQNGEGRIDGEETRWEMEEEMVGEKGGEMLVGT